MDTQQIDKFEKLAKDKVTEETTNIDRYETADGSQPEFTVFIDY